MEEFSGKPGSRFGKAARFWEPQRIWYNVALFVVVLLWLGFTWPHFRPALTLEAFAKMTVLALLANVCYCAAYVVEFFLQAVESDRNRRRLRWAVWAFGLLLALLVENYWIADEIYPDFNQKEGAVMLGAGEMFRGAIGSASNMNFPAPSGGDGVPRGQPGNICGDRRGGDLLVRAQTETGAGSGFCHRGRRGHLSCAATRFFGGESRDVARARAGEVLLRD